MSQGAKPKLLYAEPPLPSNAVERIEEVLELAKSGKLSCVAFSAVDREGILLANWSNTLNTGLMLASIERLRHKYNRHLDEL